MVETVRIEIPIETIDETEEGLQSAVQGMKKLKQAYENAGQSARKADQEVSRFDRQAQKTEKSLMRWAKEKYQILLEAKERITPVLATLGNGLRSFTGKTWSITMRAVDFVTSPVRGIINLLKNPVFQVGAVLGVSIGLKDTIETYKNFEAAMSQVQAISGATGSEVAKLTNKAKEMGATTKFTAAESAEAFNYMAMAGWKTNDMLSGIEGILSLAAASGEELGTTSDIVTDALTAFNMTAADSGRFSDVLAAAASSANTNVSMMGETFKYAGTMAGSLGYTIEDVALMTGLMANTGLKATMAGTSLNSIFTRLSTNTGGAADAMSGLGIEFFTSEGNARDLSDVMEELRGATAGMTAEQKSQVANTIAGTEAQKGLLAILNASEKDYNKLADAINHADGAAAEMSETMMDNLQGSLIRLQSAADGVKNSFGERLSPYVRGLADWLTEQMPAIEQGLDKLMDWVDAKVDRMRRKFDEITGTREWQDADFLGKMHIAWDEFIAEPFLEWWNSTGKAKFAGIAQDIGSGIGTGLKMGIMTLLGIDLGETLDEGASIGASFAKGFSEGFDFEAVSEKLWQGFGNMLSNAGKLLPGGQSPDLSSILSAAMLWKVAKPLVGMGKGAASIGKGLFGTHAAAGTSLMGSLMGTTGDVLVEGSGLLGGLAKAGTGLTGGALAGSSAALVGAGSIAGGAIGAAGLVHGGMDLYTGFTTDDAEMAKAYKTAGAVEVGGTLAGAGAGAAAGAAIGAAFGGVGAVPGALIGAGVGAIGSWAAGNKIKEKYHKDVEEMQKEAEKAQKVFEATGLSIEDVRFESEELTQAMNDSEVSAAQFAAMFQEKCTEVARDAFGEVSLSLAEVKKAAGEITFAGMADEMDEFSEATSNTEKALGGLQASMSRLKKENWKVSLGMELSDMDKDGYKDAIEEFLETSQAYIDDNQYQATIALKLLLGEGADTAGLDGYYGSLKGQVESLGGQLTGSMNIALSDGVITLDEAGELENLHNQISEITGKLAEASTDAQMQALQIKHDGAALDIESFNAMQEELQANVASASEQYESALTLTLTNLNLQLADGAITQEEYDKAAAEAMEGYYAQVNELNARVSTFNLESISSAFGPALDGILPEIEGTTTEKLSKALEAAVLAHPDVKAWTIDDVKEWMGLDSLDLSTESQSTIAAELIQTALAVPEGTKESLIQDFKSQIPTAEEIQAALDWDSMTGRDWNALMESITGPMEGASLGMSAADAAKPLAEYFGDSFENIKKSYSEAIRSALEDSADNETLASFMQQYMTDAAGGFDFGSVMEQYGPAADDCHAQMVSEWQEAGTAFGNALNTGASASLRSGSSLLRSDLQTSLNAATASPFTISPTVKVNPNYNVVAPRFPSFGFGMDSTPTGKKGIEKRAAGGYVSGGPQLSWLAEEGYGEFVIPTNPSRRGRALELYEQAGVALGVSAHAAGGYVGAAPIPCSEPVGGSDGGEVARTYDGGQSGSVPAPGTASVQVNVNVSPEFVIQGGGGQDEEGIVRVIRKHVREMADELGGEIAVKLEEVFSNMPLKEA